MPALIDHQLAAAEAPKVVSTKPRRWLRRLAWVLAFSCALLLVCYIFRAPLLIGLAKAWEVNEPAAHADAIVVLGGGLENRPFVAAKLFHDGWASKILYMNVKLSPTAELGITASEQEATRRVLLAKGVPDSAMEVVGKDVGSTYDESRAVKAWVEKTGVRSLIIATDEFHTRRARWIFRKQLKPLGVKIHVIAVKSIGFGINDWWMHEQGLITFENEVLKSLYYHIKY